MGMIESISQLGLAFFGLTFETAPQARNQIFTQIHQIVFHGKGGYDWHTIYNMPIWLRRFTFNQIQKHYQEEKEEYENAKSNNSSNKTVINQEGKIKSPEFLKSLKSSKSPVKYK